MEDTSQKLAHAIRTIQTRMEKKRRRFLYILTIGVTLIVTIVSWLTLHNKSAILYPALSVISFSMIPSFVLYQALNRLYGKASKEFLVKTVTESIGFKYNPDGVFKLDAAARHKILPPCDRHEIEDGFEGMHRGVPVALQEVVLSDLEQDPALRKQKELMVFQGFLVRMKLPKRLEAHTVVVPHNVMETFFRTRFSSFQPIRLVSPDFERQFDVMGTDQVEGRVILNPSFMEQFMEIGKILKTKWLEASFLDDEIMFAIRRFRPLFEPDPLWKPATEENLSRIMEELGAVFRLIDVLQLNRQLRLAG
jgi:hypothetical protein